MTIDINDLTLRQINELKATFCEVSTNAVPKPVSGVMRPVIVCTEKRGVFFGYTDNVMADPMELKGARMCIYWSSKIGGVQGLADLGPHDATKSGDGSRIAAQCDAILKGITSVFAVSEAAANVWDSAPVYGRGK